MQRKKFILGLLLLHFIPIPLFAPVVAEIVADAVLAAVEIAEDNAAVIASATSSALRIAKAITSRESNTARVTAHFNKTIQTTNQNSPQVIADADSVASTLTSLSGRRLLETMIKLTPIAYSAHLQANFYNDTYLAQIFDVNPKGYIYYTRRKSKKDQKEDLESPLCGYAPQKGLFYAPLIIYNDYQSTQGDFLIRGQPGFYSYTYGVKGGWTLLMGQHMSLTGGLGYTHSNLNWRKDLGNSRWSSFYVAPTLSWFSHRTFLNFQVMGVFNFYKTDRKFTSPGLVRHAKSSYPIYDLLIHGNGGYIFTFKRNFNLQLEGTLNYLTLFILGYSESGAGALNLTVKTRERYILQPRFQARLVKSFCSKNFYYAPNLYVGWMDTIPLTEDIITAKNTQARPENFFRTRGYRDAKNQLILGAEFFAQKNDFLQLTAHFEWNYLSRISIYSSYIKMDWMF